MSTATFQRTPVEDLLFGAADFSTDYDWSEGGWGEGWESWEYGTCNTCGQLTDNSGYCENEACENNGAQATTLEGPMMNYYWPFDTPVYDDPDGGFLDFDPDEAAKKIADLPLCIVQIDGKKYAIALTGGGVDLTWEIVEGFTRIGLLPPALRPVAMADKQLNDRTKYLISALRRVREHQITQARFELEQLDRLTEHLQEQTR